MHIRFAIGQLGVVGCFQQEELAFMIYEGLALCKALEIVLRAVCPVILTK